MKWLLCWTLYGLGDAISRPMCYFDWAWLYPLYNRLMLTSERLQGSEDKGFPWGRRL